MRNDVIAIVFALPLLLRAWQSSTPSFEVADIKPSDPSVMKMGKGRMLPGGQISVPGYTLHDLIMFTWGVTEDMISGGPKWVGEERWDIVAKAPAGAPDTALRGMMESLLKDRFKLVTHQVDKPMSAYVLSVVKGAVLQASSANGGSECHWTELDGGMRRRECRNIPMAEFAKELSATGGIGIGGVPVADQTGLTGSFDLTFEVGRPRRPAGDAAPDPFDTDGPNIFSALQKIGLHLESKRVPMPAIVIDSAERPSAN